MDKKVLWRMVHTGFLVCIGLFGIGSFLGITSLGVMHVLAASLSLGLLAVFRGMKMRGRTALAGGILFVLFGSGMAAGGKTVLLFLQSYLSWLAGQAPQKAEWVAGYELLQTLFLVLFCYFLQTLMEKDSRFKPAEMLAVSASLVYFLLSHRELPRIGAAFMICYAVLLYVEWTQIHWKKEKGKSIQAYMLWLMPFLAAYFMLMLIPEIPEKPYDWQIVRNVYSRLRESFLKFSSAYLSGNGEDYDLSLSGFSEEGKLRGGNAERADEIMILETGARPAANIYLTGKAYDTFDGRQWEAQERGIRKERYLDMAETLYAVKRYDEEYQSDYLARLDLEITYKDFRSEFLFAPLKLLDLKQDRENPAVSERSGSLCFDKKRGYGTEYRAAFYQLNTGQEAFWDFVEAAASLKEDEELLKDIFGELVRTTGEKFETGNMEEYRKEVTDRYTGNVVLTPAVEAYLERITEGTETEAERLRAIEAELSSFTYTRMPGELPERVTSSGEFLDYFLLESRKGYCTYFATAFVLLARAEGLPARYVQGFCVPADGKGETMVYSNMAHAWPEVYLEGAGWIPFEPTPGYREMRYTSWRMRKDRAEAADPHQVRPVQSTEELLEEQEEAREELLEDIQAEDGLRRLLSGLGKAAPWICLIVFAVLFLNRLAAGYRYRRMSETAKFKAQTGRNLRILSLMGIERKAEETLEEFRERANHVLGREDILLFLQDYEDILYGGRNTDPLMLCEAGRQQEELLELLKRERKWRYIYYRFIHL